MKVFRCKICGDPYLGSSMPANCPWCGAHQQHIVLIDAWVDNPAGDLSEVERKQLEETLELEIDNATFYKSAMARADNLDGEMLFKALSKIEAEHASTVAKLLGVPKPDWSVLSQEAFPTHQENLKDSLRREQRAVAHYREALQLATDARVREVFGALIEIESDHIGLATERIL
jgi:rubrerythrin